ncbi:MAG: tetratricopeptide repeat protein [Spirochaetaceae bacterium]|jgi:hypothetical protein|nr:tetratricopeptide repeat protein [Spirochaetaceae bacterium]
MKDKVLHNAMTLSKKGKYGDAIVILESEVFRYRDSFRFYYLLALSCMYAGDFGRAYTYFKSAHDIKNKDVNVLLGIAALNVKRGESGRAVDLYLKVLDIEPKNRRAKNALAVLRKYGGSDTLGEWLESGKINRLYPPFPKERFNAAKAALITVLIAAAVFFGLVTAVKFSIIKPHFLEKEERPGFTDSALKQDDKEKIIGTGGTYQIILTEKQVLNLYEDARDFFNSYKDNSARVAVNKILLSNASDGIKNKSRLLLKFIDNAVPGFETLTERFSYQQVEKENYIYDGCYVIWSGMAVNVEQENDSTSFNLLVGYENHKKVVGIVTVVIPFASDIDTERPLEVLGKIVSQENSGILSLEGISIHQPIR